jgi:LPPG:FO 2-phospho-L-lactate transferase
MITALAGGVGASKLLKGLAQRVDHDELNIVVNTGDDIELYGLHVSPDVDIVMYTLADIVDQTTGWGVKDDSVNCLEMLKNYGLEAWFRLGDKDLGTHIYRTHLMNKGFRLSEVTEKLCQALGLKMKILPMSDDKIKTMVVTDQGTMHFEEYLVKRCTQDKVFGVEFEGIEKSYAAKGVVESVLSSDTVVLCPSNPIVSIGPILAVPGVREALKQTRAKVVAVSPIVGGATIKGPADKLMRGLGHEVSACGVALLYRDFLDGIVIDTVDEAQKSQIEALGIKVAVTNTVMKTLQDKVELAKTVLGFVKNLS